MRSDWSLSSSYHGCFHVQVNWVLFDFGTVTSSGANCRLNDSQIFIEWDAVMLDTALNATDYWFRAGATFNNQRGVWIESAYFNLFQNTYNGVSANPADTVWHI